MIVSFSVALNIVSKCPGCSFFHAVLWYFAYKLVVCRDFGSHENNFHRCPVKITQRQTVLMLFHVRFCIMMLFFTIIIINSITTDMFIMGRTDHSEYNRIYFVSNIYGKTNFKQETFS